MRPLTLALIFTLSFSTFCPARELDIYISRNPNLSDSVTISWPLPHWANPPLTYYLYTSATTNLTYVPDDTLFDVTSVVLPAELRPNQMRFYWLWAIDESGLTYFSKLWGTYAFVAIGGPGLVSTPFGLPFVSWNATTGVVSTRPSDIIGDQTNCRTSGNADRILRQDNGEWAIRNVNESCAWTNYLEVNHNMIGARAYWYQNRTGSNRTILLCGEADTSSISRSVTITGSLGGENVSTAYSWRDPRVRNVSDLQFFSLSRCEGQPNSDRLISQVGGQFVYLRFSDNTWQGPLREVHPGEAYWIQRRCPGNYNYIYNPREWGP